MDGHAHGLRGRGGKPEAGRAPGRVRRRRCEREAERACVGLRGGREGAVRDEHLTRRREPADLRLGRADQDLGAPQGHPPSEGVADHERVRSDVARALPGAAVVGVGVERARRPLPRPILARCADDRAAAVEGHAGPVAARERGRKLGGDGPRGPVRRLGEVRPAERGPEGRREDGAVPVQVHRRDDAAGVGRRSQGIGERPRAAVVVEEEGGAAEIVRAVSDHDAVAVDGDGAAELAVHLGRGAGGDAEVGRLGPQPVREPLVDPGAAGPVLQAVGHDQKVRRADDGAVTVERDGLAEVRDAGLAGRLEARALDPARPVEVVDVGRAEHARGAHERAVAVERDADPEEPRRRVERAAVARRERGRERPRAGRVALVHVGRADVVPDEVGARGPDERAVAVDGDGGAQLGEVVERRGRRQRRLGGGRRGDEGENERSEAHGGRREVRR